MKPSASRVAQIVAAVLMSAVVVASVIGGLVGASTWSSAAVGLGVLSIVVAQLALTDRAGAQIAPASLVRLGGVLFLGAAAVACCVVWAVYGADSTVTVIFLLVMVVGVIVAMVGAVLPQVKSRPLSSNDAPGA